MRSFAALLPLAIPFLLAAQTPPPLSCPSTLTPSGASGAAHEFERINIYNGKSGGGEYDLAPDDETKAGAKVIQTWILKDYRSMPIFVRCRYRGTGAVTEFGVPAQYQKCTFTFEIDKKGNITGKPAFSCK